MNANRVLPFAVLFACAAVSAQEKHLLRLHFKSGTVQHSAMSQEMQMSMDMGGQAMNTGMNMQMFMTVTVGEVKDAVAALEQEVTRLKVKMDNPMMTVDYDSADPKSKPGMLREMTKMLGAKVKTRVRDTGKVESTEVVSDGIDEEQAEQMTNQMAVMLPQHPVAIGETWETTTEMPMGQAGQAEVKIVNKLVALTDTHIQVEQTMSLAEDGGETAMGKISKFEGKGSSTIDVRTGLPSESSMEIHMTLDGAMKAQMVLKQSMKPTPPPAPKADAKDAPPATGK